MCVFYPEQGGFCSVIKFIPQIFRRHSAAYIVIIINNKKTF